MSEWQSQTGSMAGSAIQPQGSCEHTASKVITPEAGRVVVWYRQEQEGDESTPCVYMVLSSDKCIAAYANGVISELNGLPGGELVRLVPESQPRGSGFAADVIAQAKPSEAEGIAREAAQQVDDKYIFEGADINDDPCSVFERVSQIAPIILSAITRATSADKQEIERLKEQLAIASGEGCFVGNLKICYSRPLGWYIWNDGKYLAADGTWHRECTRCWHKTLENAKAAAAESLKETPHAKT